MKYYVDTCVWIDFVEGEKYSEDFFYKIIHNEDSIIISNLVFKEFVKHKKYSNIQSAITLLKSKQLIEFVTYTYSQNEEASKICKDMPLADALHAIIARDFNATLITRDKHFLMLRHICRLRLL
jgi:predicted nucleic acid-binding protein